MFGVNSGFCLGCDKWLGHDAVIIGARALGFSFQCQQRVLALALFECQGVWHWEFIGSAIGFISMARGLALISFLSYLIT